jgi:hypothetical protein
VIFVVSLEDSKLIKIAFEHQSVECKQQRVFADRISARKEDWQKEVVVKSVNIERW